MTESKINTIFIDWFGTLSINTFWEQWQNPAHPQHRYANPIEDFFLNEGLAKPWMRGQLTAEDFIEKLSLAIGLGSETLIKGLAESCRAMQFVSPEIPILISRLREQGKKVIIATDNMDTFPRWTIPTMKLDRLVDGVLDSHTLRALKSDFDKNGTNLFFGDYINCHQIQKAEAVLFDDSGQTEEIASRIGMIGIKLPFGQRLVESLQDLVVE